MARKFVLLDDFDGQELPEDTEPIHLSLGRTTYALYLSEDNHGKLLEALDPFIKDAETVNLYSANRPSATRSTRSAGTDDDGLTKEEKKAVREWAHSTNYKYTNAKGEEVTLGGRGRIPKEVVEAWKAAN